MAHRYPFAFALAALTASATAQPAGDALFDTDQVIEMRFTFPQPDFWEQLTANYAAGEEVSIPAGLTITDLTGTYVLDSVAVRLKGNSSYDFYPTTKKPIKLDLNKYVSGQDYHGLKKLNLANSWGDPTMLREKIFMDVCRTEGVLAPRMSFAEVFLNDVHWGFYGVIEQVDKTFLERWLDDDRGNLFKAGDNYTPDGGGLGQEANLSYYGTQIGNYEGRYELKTNETENDWSDLFELLHTIDNTSNAQVGQELPQRFAWNEVLRSLALDNLYGNMDAYYGSARNYYLYHDSTTLRWIWVHWDANMCFGRYVPQWVTDVGALPATYTSPGRRLLQRIFSNTDLRRDYLNAYCDLFERFTNAEMDPRINALRDLVQPHVYADQNKEYQDIDFDENIEHTVTAFSGGSQSTIPGLKSFIAARRQELSTTLDCTTAGIAGPGHVTLGVFPNPTAGAVTVMLPPGTTFRDLHVSDALGHDVQVPITAQGIDLGALPSGGYLIQLITAQGQARTFVVKE